MERIVIIFVTLSVLSLCLAQDGRQFRAPPPTLGRPFEKFTNMTIDELITGTLGGVDVASNLILADDGHILAELDMYLSEEQFLSMYEPPKPEDMIKMGMMPAPLGAPPNDDNYFFDFEEDYKGSGIRTKRKAVRETNLRWTNAEVPYLFARGHFEEKEEYLMRRAMTEWERYTCLRFRPAESTDKNSVRFQNGVGCNSQLGMVGGIQVLNLEAPGCRFKGLYLHEIGHAVGLVHEHQLPDRDNYIDILYYNVAPHMRIWFNKYTTSEVDQKLVPYEYSSVMHYGITAFAQDGKSQTIRSKDPSKEDSIGKVYLKELSYTDIKIVNLMYGCASHCTNTNQCGPEGTLDQNCNCICKDGSSDCDRTVQATDETCVNNYDSWACYIWANQGECERNPFYMKQQCAKACGECGMSGNSKGGCKDVFQQNKCTSWKERGDCVTNQRWMKENCRFTCGLCGDETVRPEVSCENEHDEEHKCDEWARDGECAVNRKWMFSNCRKSCAFCEDEDVDTDEGDGGIDEDDMLCENTHHNCDSWARTGECENNHSWMIPNCRKACGKCDDGTCKNFYDDIQCKIWAQKLECLTNSKWMALHCAKSCGRGLCEGVDPESESTTPITGGGSRTTYRPTTTGGNCRNRHSSDTECDIWAKNDHCNINPNWMLKNCAKSCNQCSGGGRRDGGGSTTTKGTRTTDNGTGTGTGTGTIDNCVDSDRNCVSWAKHGFCDSNPRYNLIACKKSCNNCNGCRDAEFLCSVWAKDGHCEKNPRYMLRHCQKSCKACHMSNDVQELKPETGEETDTRMGGINPDNGSTRSIPGAQILMASFGLFFVLVRAM